MPNKQPTAGTTQPNQAPRYMGLDVGKHSVMVAAVDASQQIVLQPKKISILNFQSWACQNLRPSDSVVLEATSNAWQFYDQLCPLVERVVVANPTALKLIAQNGVKTDAKDAINLAKLLAANLIPPVWVPPQPVRELRALISHRQRLVQQRTRCRNRLHAILQTYNLLPPTGDPFSQHNQTWWGELKLSTAEKLLIKQELSLLQSLEPLLAEVETELRQQSTDPLWSTQATLLIQLPGIGMLTAMTILAAIGDISRFAGPKQLVGYSGMGARVFATGQTFRTGAITKQGRPELRTAMVEAAWSAVTPAGHWKELFEKLAVRLGNGRAIVAIARKLLVVVWHVLTRKVADQQAEPTRVAQKFLSWAYKLGKEGRHGLGGTVFVRVRLEQLALGDELTEVKWGNLILALPPPSPKVTTTKIAS